MTTTSVPEPASRRWKPLRTGLVDIFYYDVEEFHFHDGRLLLRGNNGTGKSKVLALTLPFLLDGELSPHRVEPDGDRQKRMDWNLLLGGKHPQPERVGYTWMEFGRVRPDGTAEFCTVGCGLKAVRDRGIARHWYFVTPQRVGMDLSLLGRGRVPLTRERLRDAVEGQGLVYDRTADYRRAVDEALFGLGERRYKALVNLLIQLRQPQLSKKPDEKRLSTALTEALAPVSADLIRTVADAFRGLDEERHAIDALREAEGAAAEFMRHYRRYAEVAAKRQVRGPRETHSRYEQLGRDLVEAERNYAEADSELRDAQERLDRLAGEQDQRRAQLKALEQSPEMRDAERLSEREAEAGRLDSYARSLEADEDRTRKDVERRRDAAERAQSRRDTAAQAFEAHRQAAGEGADRAGCGTAHQEAADGWEADPGAARHRTEALAKRQATAVGELGQRLEVVDKERTRLDAARREVDRLAGELQADAERIAGAEQTVGDESQALSQAYRSCLASAVELRLPDPDGVVAELDAWAANVEGPNPAAEAVEVVVQQTTTELAKRETGLETERDERRETVRELTEQIERLEAGGHEPPPVPYTRGTEARSEQPGAPLWKVIDFVDAVPDEHRAGLEAALEASGILDSWLAPDGVLRGADDTIIVSVDTAGLDGWTCADVLRPALDPDDPQSSALSGDTVRSALAAIGLGPADGRRTWVGTAGQWANGVLTGSWQKPEAVFIGEGAREQARRAALERTRAELAGCEARLEELYTALREVADKRQRLDAERRARPSDDALRESHVQLAGAHAWRHKHEEAHAAAGETVREREATVTAAWKRAEEFASDVSLPPEPADLDAVKAGLDDYRVALAGLWPAAEALLDAHRAVRDAEEELADAEARLGEVTDLAAAARKAASAAAETYRVLQATVGEAVEELHRKLATVEQEMKRCEEDERATKDVADRARESRGKADGERARLAEAIASAEAERDTAIAEFQQFVATGVLRVALPDLETPDPGESWATTPAVQLARSVNAAFEHVDDGDGAWDRVQKRFTEEHKVLSDAMARHGHQVGITPSAGVLVVDVVFQGRSREVPELTAALRTEIDERAQLLSAREREILENHLLNEVAGTLHELITDAEDDVRAMNEELASRPTSTGMRLRLLWRAAKDAPDGLDRVRSKLRQTVDAWSEDDRNAVGAFLQEQIDQEHAENPAAGWFEQLTRALDYRTWHEFTIQRYQDGQWRPATGPASGGERALAASVPLFAAASAHYKSAGNPDAPRLVALDEAFAGVDDDSRAKCLGLLATFDVDVVMTSEREWGCYPEVPGLAISHLARRDGVDAVLVTPWRWDGRERCRVDRPVPAMPAESAGPADQDEEPDLFSVAAGGPA